MLLDNEQHTVDNDIEFLFERPVGWSSACLDSTINYYLNHNSNDITLEKNIEIADMMN